MLLLGTVGSAIWSDKLTQMWMASEQPVVGTGLRELEIENGPRGGVGPKVGMRPRRGSLGERKRSKVDLRQLDLEEALATSAGDAEKDPTTLKQTES